MNTLSIRIITCTAALLMAVGFSSCRTTKGLGQDIQNLGSTMERAVP